jgi:hypothetical protein
MTLFGRLRNALSQQRMRLSLSASGSVRIRENRMIDWAFAQESKFEGQGSDQNKRL